MSNKGSLKKDMNQKLEDLEKMRNYYLGEIIQACCDAKTISCSRNDLVRNGERMLSELAETNETLSAACEYLWVMNNFFNEGSVKNE